MVDISTLLPTFADDSSPPPILFKYLSPDQTYVLRNGSIRFTPLAGTNDPFEVRSVFRQMAGLKMRSLLLQQVMAMDAKPELIKFMQRQKGVSAEVAGKLVEIETIKAFGHDPQATFQAIIADLVDQLMLPYFNSDQHVNSLLDRVGGLLALSLAEPPHNMDMWFKYAADSKGFVIAFDTRTRFFHIGPYDTPWSLRKVSYFDGQFDELLDAPEKAFGSKELQWQHEKEWRLYGDAHQASIVLQTRDPNGNLIHLFAFPNYAVTRVIVGHKAEASLVNELRELMPRMYPHAQLTKVRIQRYPAEIIEEAISF